MAASGLAALVLLALGAGLTFDSDEWAFIGQRSLADPLTWVAPHNEHWATGLVLVYGALVEIAGLGSYMPYLAVLVALHLTVAALVYVLVRRDAGPWPALAVAVVTLFLGGGFENLYWAMQIGFVGSLAAGLGAMLAIDARGLTVRRALVFAVLLTIAVATTGIGLVCLVAVTVELLLDARRRRWVWLSAVPAGIFAAWFLAIGRAGLAWHEGAYQVGGPEEIARSVLLGFSTTVGTATGVGTELGGLLLLVGLTVLCVWAVRRRPAFAPRFVGCIVAIACLYALIGATRWFAGPNVTHLTRYSYVSAILLAIALSAQLGPWWRRSARTPNRWVVVGAALFALSITFNVQLLVAGRAIYGQRAEATRALVTVALDRPLPDGVDPTRPILGLPSPNDLRTLVEARGSPLSDSIVPWAVQPVRPDALAAARQMLQAASISDTPLPPRVDLP